MRLYRLHLIAHHDNVPERAPARWPKKHNETVVVQLGPSVVSTLAKKSLLDSIPSVASTLAARGLLDSVAPSLVSTIATKGLLDSIALEVERSVKQRAQLYDLASQYRKLEEQRRAAVLDLILAQNSVTSFLAR